MASQTLTQLQQSAAPTLPGTWKLGAGRAITLCPREDGRLRIAHGRLWATFDGPHPGALNEQGDLVVGAGEYLNIRAGERVVAEAWDGEAPAYFTWDPQAAPVRAASASLAGVVQPLADLRLALGLGAGAAARLAVGLVRLAFAPLAPRALSAPASACRAHGAMS
jgi:hypothetical protein